MPLMTLHSSWTVAWNA